MEARQFYVHNRANESLARMSSRVRLKKSLRILASVIPEARYSRMSYTGDAQATNTGLAVQC